MKTIKKFSPISLLIIIMLMSNPALNQRPPPPPPPPPDNHGAGGNANAGIAPIGGGVLILLGLPALYSGKKAYDLNKERLEE